MKVKLVVLGEDTQEFEVEQGATVGAVLELAEVELEASEDVMIRGAEVKSEDLVAEGDIIAVISNVKGG